MIRLKTNIRRYLAGHTTWFGMIATGVCLLALTIGITFQQGRNGLYDTISLIASHETPNGILVNLFFTAYNILLMMFGLGWWYVKSRRAIRDKVAAKLMVVIGSIGLIACVFPQDQPNMPMSAIGIIHKILVISMTIIALITVFIQARFEKRRHLIGRSRFSQSMTVILLLGSIGATVAIENDWLIGGLLERLTLFGFLAWLFIESLIVYKMTRD